MSMRGQMLRLYTFSHACTPLECRTPWVRSFCWLVIMAEACRMPWACKGGMWTARRHKHKMAAGAEAGCSAV